MGGYARIQETDGLIPNSVLIDMFRLLKGREDGFRVTPGTALKHDRTGSIVYVPPQDARDIVAQMTALERFVNDDMVSDLDPLIKMALIHHQFESIHPFPDGNGRIGRILNVLYLSRHVTRHKAVCYRLLQAVRDSGGVQGAWQDWVEGVAGTAVNTLRIVEGNRDQMARAKHRMRAELPRLLQSGVSQQSVPASLHTHRIRPARSGAKGPSDRSKIPGYTNGAWVRGEAARRQA